MNLAGPFIADPTTTAGLRAVLESLIIGVQSGWNAEHATDGTHTAVTALSAAITGGLSAGQFRLSRGVVTLSSLPTANFIEAAQMQGVSRLIIPSAGASAGRIHGMSATGRNDGDMVLLQNYDAQSSGGGFTVRLGASGTYPADCAGFFGTPGTPNVDVAIGQNRCIWAVFSTYDKEQGATGKVGDWHLHML